MNVHRRGDQSWISVVADETRDAHRRRTEFLGHVQAPDREAAAAAERFNLTEEQGRRLVLQEQLSRYLGG